MKEGEYFVPIEAAYRTAKMQLDMLGDADFQAVVDEHNPYNRKNVTMGHVEAMQKFVTEYENTGKNLN